MLTWDAVENKPFLFHKLYEKKGFRDIALFEVPYDCGMKLLIRARSASLALSNYESLFLYVYY